MPFPCRPVMVQAFAFFLVIRALVSFLAVPESSKMEPSNTQTRLGAPMSTISPSTISTELVCKYHEPPPGVDYSSNLSVFGKILRGQAPAIVLAESPNILAFRDRSPKAKFHALVIPKQFIPTVASLSMSDLPILQEMRDTAYSLLEQHQPKAFEEKDYLLVYHKPPWNSVDHLHLHVLAPASKMNFVYRNIKYQARTPWCDSEGTIRQRLKLGKKAM